MEKPAPERQTENIEAGESSSNNVHPALEQEPFNPVILPYGKDLLRPNEDEDCGFMRKLGNKLIAYIRDQAS